VKYFLPVLLIFMSVIAAAQPGTLDLSFNKTGMVVIALGDTDNCGHSIAIQHDGKLIISGSPYIALGNCFITVRLNPDGIRDSTFGIRGVVTTSLEPGANEEAYSTVLQPDGKILVGGYSNGKFGLVRYLENGTPDPSFGTGGIVLTNIGINGRGSKIALQQDGKILMTGSGNLQFTTVRYLPDGTPDSSFGNSGIVGTLVDSLSTATSLCVQRDGKIVVAGSSVFDFALVRYRTDGSLDSAFGVNGMVITPVNMTSPPVLDVVIQDDGKILAAGGLYTTHVTLARYLPDGSPDPSFGVNGMSICPISSPASSNALALQKDGKIIASGHWSPGNQVLWYAMSRMNTNGSVDTTFGVNGAVYTAIQGVHEVANAVSVQEDGKIVLAGCSHHSGGGNCDYVVTRYNGGELGIPEYRPQLQFAMHPNPSGDKIIIEIKSPGFSHDAVIKIFSVQGSVLLSSPLKSLKTEVSVRSLPEGTYIVRLTSGDRSSEQKLIIKR
jgi:uncharacterized delta-60 repeat protein